MRAALRDTGRLSASFAKPVRLLMWNGAVLCVAVCIFVDGQAVASAGDGVPRSNFTGSVQPKDSNLYHDKPIRSLVLHGRLVYCNSEIDIKAYPDPVYTCKNLSIDGWRLLYGIGGNNRVLDSTNLCGTDSGRSSLYDLCTALLIEAGVGEQLVAAHVTEAVCLGDKGRRMLFVRNGTRFYWEEGELRTGYVVTLRCVTKRPALFKLTS